MANDKYYPQKYINSKGQVTKHYVWSSKLEEAEFKCPHTGELLTFDNIYEEEVNAAPGIKPHGEKGRSAQERKKRQSTHFKKEIYPTLQRGSAEQKHFGKKYGLK